LAGSVRAGWILHLSFVDEGIIDQRLVDVGNAVESNISVGEAVQVIVKIIMV
jgi:hypothetical protein